MFRLGSRRFRCDATVLADSFLGLSGSLGSGGRGVVALGNSSPGGVMGFLAITLHQIHRLSVLVDGLLVILKERTFPSLGQTLFSFGYRSASRKWCDRKLNCDMGAKLLLQQWQYVVHKTEDLQFSNEVLQYCFPALGDVLLLTAEGDVLGWSAGTIAKMWFRVIASMTTCDAFPA